MSNDYMHDQLRERASETVLNIVIVPPKGRPCPTRCLLLDLSVVIGHKREL